MKFLRILLFLCVGFEILYAESMIDWIDIPQADYKVILGSQEVEIENLNQLIDHYHSIDKSFNDLSKLEIALSNIDPYIIKKIQFCKNIIIGVGAHPKHILKLKTIYDKNDLIVALQMHPSGDLNYSDLLLVKTIMESLSIIEIKYLSSLAGNTSGLFLLERCYKFKDKSLFRKDCSLPIR